MAIQIIFTILVFACCPYAIWWGGAPERWMAIFFLVASILTAIADIALPATPGQMRWGVFAIDLIALVSFATIALKANRWWPIWFTALQLVTVSGHLVNLWSVSEKPWAYAASIVAAGMLMPPLLAFATHSHLRRVRRHGAEPPWSRF